MPACGSARPFSTSTMVPPIRPDAESVELSLGSIEAIPVYLAFTGVSLFLLTLALLAYALLTPTREFALTRSGNGAAAASLAGAMVGFALPLASVLARSETMTDLVIWSITVLLVQLLILVGLRRIAPAFDRGISEARIGSGVFLAALAIALGLLNAAAIPL